MIRIDKETNGITVTIRCNTDMYMSMLKSLCGILASQNDDIVDGREVADVAMLLQDLIPSLDEMKELVKGVSHGKD